MNTDHSTGENGGSRGVASGHHGAESLSVEVALATYESARFLEPLLDSLFAQSDQNFTLLVADDGSVDGTPDILDRYALRYPGRIRLIASERQPGGPQGNFGRLIAYASADYLFLCDHDDVWLPNKITRSLERMAELENVRGKERPLLIHTDLTVVDENLEVLGPSFFRYSNIDPSRNDFTSLLTANVATGCTILMNRALYKKASPIPPEAMMHDHWLALVAATSGTISCIEEPTVLYRQHAGNVIGAQSGGTASLLQRVRETLFSDARQRVMRRYSLQAAALVARYGNEMSGEARRVAETLSEIWSVSRWRRFARLRRNGLGLSGFTRNAALMIVVSRGIADDRDSRQPQP
ncbi:MAG TPA: glycosyltransferase family 2 protein [Allosphingosinicella sp.]|jgi:glycosyltransferase involved in cell wall biosynthesis